MSYALRYPFKHWTHRISSSWIDWIHQSSAFSRNDIQVFITCVVSNNRCGKHHVHFCTLPWRDLMIEEGSGELWKWNSRRSQSGKVERFRKGEIAMTMNWKIGNLCLFSCIPIYLIRCYLILCQSLRGLWPQDRIKLRLRRRHSRHNIAQTYANFIMERNLLCNDNDRWWYLLIAPPANISSWNV